MKKIIILLFLLPVTVYSEQEVGYFIAVPPASQWGLYMQNLITNNQGEKGTLTGTSSFVWCAPSLEYGVSLWSDAVPTKYSCTQSQKKVASKPVVGQCRVMATAAGTKKQVSISQYFIQMQQFYNGIDTTIKSLVNAFPDYTKGQSPNSKYYLALAQKSSTQTNQIAIASSNVAPITKNPEQYFPGGVITFALDFTQLVGTQNQPTQNQQNQTNTNQQTDSSDPFLSLPN